MSTPLKLRAVDEDDLAVLGAFLQDALVPVQDMCFLEDERRFVIVANRFCWENLQPAADGGEEGEAEPQAEASAPAYERVHCGITIEHVNRVQARGFTPGSEADKGRLLEMLTIMPEDGALTLHFSGGAAVRIEADRIEAFVQDLGDPWPTLWRPRHPIEDGVDQEGGTG
ncbi:MAG TPA: DUF2948 family protein [Alphaproteobacteria bacterium]|nr:DUF2948 family protein [Alphaproteobacteria bacterium]